MVFVRLWFGGKSGLDSHQASRARDRIKHQAQETAIKKHRFQRGIPKHKWIRFTDFYELSCTHILLIAIKCNQFIGQNLFRFREFMFRFRENPWNLRKSERGTMSQSQKKTPRIQSGPGAWYVFLKKIV